MFLAHHDKSVPRGLSVRDMQMLANIVGLTEIHTKKKGKRTLSQFTKPEAIASIKQRHDDLVKFQESQAAAVRGGPVLAAFAQARDDGAAPAFRGCRVAVAPTVVGGVAGEPAGGAGHF